MRSFIKSYGLTILGGLIIACFIAASMFFITRSSITALVAANVQNRADNFAEFLISPSGGLDSFITGIARSADTETSVKLIANLSGIRSFAVFDTTGTEVYRSRSDRYDWLIRNRPGGMQTGDRVSDAAMAREGDWQTVAQGADGNPSVLMPLDRHAKRVGYLSVSIAKVAPMRAAFASTLTGTSLSVLVVIIVVAGVPLLVYWRRKRVIDAASERIRFLGRHDPLTGLLNRRTMQEECDRLLSSIRATHERMAYLFIDIDELAEINDHHGQSEGDEFIKTIANRLRKVTSDRNDMLARIGPDDFAILYRRLVNEAEVPALADRIIDAVCEPIELQGGVTIPRISIGCALVPSDGRNHSELVKHAEIAHQRHKVDKARNVVFFEIGMDAAVHRRRELDTLLRAAIANEAFEIFFQPIVGPSGQLIGFEALVRMRDHNGDYVSPAEFVPVAEARGHIKKIGTFVLRGAAKQIASWPEDLFVSVNLSTMQFLDGDLIDIVKDVLDESGIDGSRLEIEVVESLLLEPSDMVFKQLTALKKLGVRVDMDDFGTGYSSLSYLWRFPFDKLKIDQSFMVALENQEPNVPRILEAIVSMAHHMDMKVTVEGVENQDQVDLMRTLGCDQFQGYFFGKPLPAREIPIDMLKRVRQGCAEDGKSLLDAAGPEGFETDLHRRESL